MHVIRKDGNEITLSEEKIVLELFKGRTYPTPYTHKELIAFNNVDGTLELSVKVNNADEDVSTKYILTFFDNQCEGVYREIYMDCVTADSTRWRVLRKFCDYRLEEIEEELTAILGTDYKTHAIIVSYNDLDVYVRRWKCASRAAALTGKDHLYADASWFDADEELHSQLEMLWMFAVVKFGTFSGSPKSGRIDDLDKFELWCDEITQTYSYDIGSIEYINKQEEKEND